MGNREDRGLVWAKGAPADSVQSQGSGRERRGGEKGQDGRGGVEMVGEGRGGWEGAPSRPGEAGQVLSRTSVVLSTGCCHGGGAPGWVPAHPLCVATEKSNYCLLSIYFVTLWCRLISLSAQPASHAPSPANCRTLSLTHGEWSNRNG